MNEEEVVNDIDADNKLLSYGTTILANSISSSAVDQQGFKVASLMINTPKAILEKANTKLQCWTKDLGTLKKIPRNDKVFRRKKLLLHLLAPSPSTTKLRHCGLVICKKINILFGVGRGR